MIKHFIVTFSLVLLFASNFSFPQEIADIVYKNGSIYTVNSHQPWAEALAIKSDRFIYVGNNSGVEELIGPETKVVDLNEQFVMPGLYDLHVHPDLLFEPKYTNQIQTLPLGPEELKTEILEYANNNPGDGWIFGGTWAPDLFAGAGIEPNAKYLDSFISDRPVALLETGRHVMMVNSLAMQLAGIDKNTYTPDHGIVVRDDQGNPTGEFANGAQSLFSHVLPQATWQQFSQCYNEAQALLNSYGIVGARSQHVNTDRLKAVQFLERQGELTIRYDMSISWKNDLHFSVEDRAELISGERHRYRSKHVNANFVKFHFDGTPASKSGYFLDPYRGTENHFGMLNETTEEIMDLMVQLDRQQISAQIHVIGDAAARIALDAIEHARKINGPNGPRHMLAHTYALHDDDVKRIAELNIVAEFTFNLVSPDMKDGMNYFVDEVVAQSTGPRLLNIKPVLESGGKAVFGSDLVVSPNPNPFPAISELLDRDSPWKSITVEDAILMLTLNGAWAMYLEDIAGSIEVGKYADFAVLDNDLFKIPAFEVRNINVLLTVFEGKVVYEKK